MDANKSFERSISACFSTMSGFASCRQLNRGRTHARCYTVSKFQNAVQSWHILSISFSSNAQYSGKHKILLEISCEIGMG